MIESLGHLNIALQVFQTTSTAGISYINFVRISKIFCLCGGLLSLLLFLLLPLIFIDIAIVKAAISISTSSNNNEEPWRVFASVCGNFWDFLIFLSASEQSQMFPRNNMKYCLLFGAKSAKFLGLEIISFPRLLFSHWFVVTVVTASEKWKNLIVTSVHSDSMWFCYHFTKCSTPMSRIEWSGFLYCWPKTQHIIINCSWKIGNFGMLIRVIC